jgi:predicted DNA-binding protein (MmcQ/YjbR family)
MDVETFREHCLRKAGVTEDSPFGPEHVVFKVGGKMFALLAFEDVPPTANLKCDPDLALELRDRYEDVQPGYHMNKKHWNTVRIDGAIPQQELTRMIDHSYELVVRSLPKAQRNVCEAAKEQSARRRA